MKSISVRISLEAYEKIKVMAEYHNRSITQEIDQQILTFEERKERNKK